MPINVSGIRSFAPKTKPLPPYVLDESVPRPKDPLILIRERQAKKILEHAKNKPANERNLGDYFVLAKDKLDHIDLAKY